MRTTTYSLDFVLNVVTLIPATYYQPAIAEPSPMAKGWKIEGLIPEQPLNESARRIIITKFREAFHYRTAVETGLDSEAVHDMRVSLRRLWAAMHSFHNCFADAPEFARLIRHTRKLARRLGAVRDLDVMIEMLAARACADGLSEAAVVALQTMITHCQKKRHKQHKRLLRYLAKLDERQFEDVFLRFFAVNYSVPLPLYTAR
ncbi:MAG: CHAD domain-containing protein [Acidobacteriota bacterium]